jgi:hypothetical protein
MHVRAKGLMWTPEILWQASIVDLELTALAEPVAAVPSSETTILEGGDPATGSAALDETVASVLVNSTPSSRVRFVAQQPQRAIRPSTRMARKKVPVPFSFLLVECTQADEAVALIESVKGLMTSRYDTCWAVGRWSGGHR